MRKYVEATASAPITKTGKPFTKYRYTISLMINELNTTIHAHSRTKAGARVASKALASEAEAYLEEAGLMPVIFQKVMAAREGRPELPAIGTHVWLTTEVAGLPEGTKCLVIESEWTEEDRDLLPENTFPITVMPVNLSEGEVEGGIPTFPLALGEFKLAGAE